MEQQIEQMSFDEMYEEMLRIHDVIKTQLERKKQEEIQKHGE